MCLKSITTYHLKPEVGVSWRSIFSLAFPSCSERWGAGVPTGASVLCVCSARFPAVQAGAERSSEPEVAPAS